MERVPSVDVHNKKGFKIQMTETQKPNDINCKGCFTIDKCIISRTDWGRYYYTERIEDRCPCYACLIKVMCDDSCEEYSNFAVTIRSCLTEHVRKHHNSGVKVSDVLDFWFDNKGGRRYLKGAKNG